MFIIQIIIVQGVIFVAFVFGLYKLMIKSSYKETRRLQQLNEENTQRSKELKESIDETRRKYREKMMEADEQIKKMKNIAKKEAEEIKEIATIEAKQEKNRLMEQALKSKEAIREEVERLMNERALSYALKMVKELLSFKNQELMHGRFLEEVIKEIEDIDAEALQIKGEEGPVQMTSAFKMSGSQQSKLEDILNEKIGKKISIEETEDQSLIAGVIIQIGGLVIDGSMKSKLDVICAQVMKE